MSILERIKDRVVSIEHGLFQFGMIVLCAGLPISTSVIEIGKGIIIVSFIIALIRRRVSLPVRDVRIIAAAAFFLCIIISSVIASFGPHAAHSWGRFPGMIAFFLLFLAFAAMFDLKRDGVLVLVLFAAMAVNGSFIVREFMLTRVRSGGLFHPVMSNVHFWPAATLIVIGLIFTVKNIWARLFFVTLLVFNIAVIVSLFSTAAFIVFPVLMILLVIVIAPRKIALASVFGFLLSVISVVFLFQNRLLETGVQEKIAAVIENRPVGISQRTYFWRGAGELVKEHPFFGIGNGLWKFYFYDGTTTGREYIAKGMDRGYFHTHNNAVEIAVAYGIPALLCVALFFAAVFMKGFIFLRTLLSRGYREYALGAAMITGVAAVLLQGLSDYTIFAVTGGSFVWALLGAIIAMEKRH